MSDYTPRGFKIYSKFTDSYGHEVRVQESSYADGRRVWIFCVDPNDANKNVSAHLTEKAASEIAKGLLQFVKDGRPKTRRKKVDHG